MIIWLIISSLQINCCKGKLLRSCSIFPAPTFPLPAGTQFWHHAGELGQPWHVIAEMTVNTGDIDTEFTHACSAVDILVVLTPCLCVFLGLGFYYCCLLLRNLRKLWDLRIFVCLIFLVLFSDTGLRKEFLGEKSSNTYFTMLAIIKIWIHFRTVFCTVQTFQCLLQVKIYLHVFLTTVLL